MNDLVYGIQQRSDILIDYLMQIPMPKDTDTRAEVTRLMFLAVSNVHEACDRAVKAATKALEIKK